MLMRTRCMAHLGMVAALIFAGAIPLAGPSVGQVPPSDAAARRLASLKLKGEDAEALGQLQKALGDKDVVVARTAARLLVRHCAPDSPSLKQALKHGDMLLRRTVVMGLGVKGSEALGLLSEALKDDHVLVRQAAVFSLGCIRPRSEPLLQLLAEAGKDEDPGVREAALQAAKSFFSRVDEVRLPKDGWKFKLDPERVGEGEKWSAVDFDDSGWDDSEIEQAWQLLGYDYVGTAWYRRTVELPDKPKADKVELACEGVDESAWVWVNGEYAGEHDIGPSGWDKPFRLDVTDLLVWGQPNQITVRAMNTAARGGIWQPVRIVVLALEE